MTQDTITIYLSGKPGVGEYTRADGYDGFNAIGHLAREDFKLTTQNINRNLNGGGVYVFDIIFTERIMNKLLLNLPEIIATPRLKLQMPKAGFGQKLYKAISDGYDDYVKWLNWPHNMPTVSMLEEECRKHHADFILREFIRYLIIEKETDEIVGRCAFPSFQANWMVPQFGISYFIRQSKRSKGYATEAAHAMALLAFKMLGAKKLEIYCDAENIASTKIPLKLGFKLEYTQRGGWPRYDGQLAELQTYSLFSENDLPHLEVQ